LVKDFSCCIVPPKNLKDPARVGQAAENEDIIALLRGVRKVPDSLWPISRGFLQKKAEDVLAAAFPGISDDDRKIQGEKAGQILDRVRSLSDVDFEMQKEDLAKSWDPKASTREKKASKPVNSGHYAATFLMLPGATRAYDSLIARLKTAQTASTAQTDLKSIQGAENCQDGHCALKNGGNIPR
jgi:hypothetical protein